MRTDTAAYLDDTQDVTAAQQRSSMCINIDNELAIRTQQDWELRGRRAQRDRAKLQDEGTDDVSYTIAIGEFKKTVTKPN